MCVCACSVLQFALCKDTIVISFYGNICIILITEEALGSLKSAVKKLHLLKFTFPLSRSLSLTFSTLFPPCPFRLPDESEGRQPSRERRDGERYFYHSIVCSSHLKRVTFFSRKRTRLHIQHGMLAFTDILHPAGSWDQQTTVMPILLQRKQFLNFAKQLVFWDRLW